MDSTLLKTHTHLNMPGPFHPISPNVVKKILDPEFVEMVEVTIDDIISQVPGHPPPPAWLPITNISQWVEWYSLMAAILCSKIPDKARHQSCGRRGIMRASDGSLTTANTADKLSPDGTSIGQSQTRAKSSPLSTGSLAAIPPEGGCSLRTTVTIM